MSIIKPSLNELRILINARLASKEPWQIIAITATSVISFLWLHDLLTADEGIKTRLLKSLFKWAKKIPYVKKRIDDELNKISAQFDKDIQKRMQDVPYITTLPEQGLSDEEIVKMAKSYLNLGTYKWKEGRVSGAVYYYDPELIELNTKIYGMTSYTNPLHPDVFPGVSKMEAEVVRITAKLFHGGPNACGTMTTGGTESIIMACKAYRDYARERGITKPNIVMPVTAHSGFDKAAQYLGLGVRTVRVDPETTLVDLKAMKRAINGNTCMLVASAPNFPYGTMDDVQGVAELGLKYNIPVHVDACLGGFVIAFMRKAGFELPPFDFEVEGVTSISADTHKYGFAPKGSSVILYSDKKYRDHQFVVTTDWPGGVYGSPTVNGSRTGGIIAACWSTLLRFGETGYIDATKKIIDTTKYVEKEIRKIDEVFIFGKPATTVVALGSKVFDIYHLADKLGGMGWSLNVLQFPSGIHICITHVHTQNGVADQFLDDMKSCIAEIMKNPSAPVEGKMAIYGMAQSVPDRSTVTAFTKCYINSMYYTPADK
ncbi:sphingosine-1-phosphate lyase-like isoform X1 [Ctenocephalides felis]|uniref:sphingosine-1-phosphate lyase-like isoform X1 n=1 Tax=Ctenocephalides felis TaxID=7515 RepID=UPI000E6E4E1C|nr:sphingosine-1-phosphate lyase-like isoform X1 [Ctenocephalides felis]